VVTRAIIISSRHCLQKFITFDPLCSLLATYLTSCFCDFSPDVYGAMVLLSTHCILVSLYCRVMLYNCMCFRCIQAVCRRTNGSCTRCLNWPTQVCDGYRKWGHIASTLSNSNCSVSCSLCWRVMLFNCICVSDTYKLSAHGQTGPAQDVWNDQCRCIFSILLNNSCNCLQDVMYHQWLTAGFGQVARRLWTVCTVLWEKWGLCY